MGCLTLTRFKPSFLKDALWLKGDSQCTLLLRGMDWMGTFVPFSLGLGGLSGIPFSILPLP